MTNFSETPEGQAFIATGDARETSFEVMEAIAFFAWGPTEAEAIWNGDGIGSFVEAFAIWERVTRSGHIPSTDFCWGAAGPRWAKEIGAE